MVRLPPTDKDYEYFGVAPSASVKSVKQAWHAHALRLHPDQGGTDVEAFNAMRLCYIKILDAVSRCPRCEGSGHVNQQNGFATLQVKCPLCYGTGERPDEEKNVAETADEGGHSER